MHDGATREFDATARCVKGRFKGRQRLANQSPKSTQTEGYATLYHSVLFGWAPLGRGSHGRFGLRRFRAKLNITPFGTHRAFTHALPSSFGLRSVPSTSIGLFFPLRSSEEKNKPIPAEREKT